MLPHSFEFEARPLLIGSPMQQPLNLEQILDKVRKDVKTESYSMSIGELIGMYEKDEIILKP